MQTLTYAFVQRSTVASYVSVPGNILMAISGFSGLQNLKSFGAHLKPMAPVEVSKAELMTLNRINRTTVIIDNDLHSTEMVQNPFHSDKNLDPQPEKLVI